MENSCTYPKFKQDNDGRCKNGYIKKNNMCYVNSMNSSPFNNHDRCDAKFDHIPGVTNFDEHNKDYPLFHENDYAKIIIQTNNFPFLDLDETALTVTNSNKTNTFLSYDISYVVCDYSDAVTRDRLLDESKFYGLEAPSLNLDDFNFVNKIFIQSYKVQGFFGNYFINRIKSKDNFFLRLIKSYFFSNYVFLLPNLGKKEIHKNEITTSSEYDNNVIKIMISYITPQENDNFTFKTSNSVNDKSFVFISDKLIVYDKSLALYYPYIKPVNDKKILMKSNKLYQLIWISFCPNKHTKYKINHNNEPQRINNIHQLSYTSEYNTKVRFFSNIKRGGSGVNIKRGGSGGSLTPINFANTAILSFHNKFILNESYKITAPVKKADTNIFMVHSDKYKGEVIDMIDNNVNNLEAKQLNYEVKYNPLDNDLSNTAIYGK